MDKTKLRHVMPLEVSALNTYWLVQYLHQHYPDLDLQQLIDQIGRMYPCYVRNLQTGELEQVNLRHLRNPRYWFSHQFVLDLHNLIEKKIADPRLGFKIGCTLYKTQPVIKTAIGIPLLGLHRVASRVSREAAKFNRTKQYHVQRLDRGLVEIRIIHDPGIVVCDFAMQWNAGCFVSYARLAGATDISVDIRCVDPGPASADDEKRAIWDFEIRYKEPTLLTRITKAFFSHIPWIRELTARAEAVEDEHQEQIINRDRIIRERTDKLLSIQRKLINQERQNIEQKLRNISFELVNTEERERRAIAEDLHDSVTQLLALSLSKVKFVQRHHSEIEELIEIRTYLERCLADIRSLTFQISPPVLYDFGLEAALQWLVTDVNTRHNMQLVYTNLLESPLETGEQQKVTVYRAVRELIINMIKHARTTQGQVMLCRENDLFIAEVADEGVGFQPESIRPGFGLFSLKDRLLCLGGAVDISSTIGEGTVVQLSIPFAQMALGAPN